MIAAEQYTELGVTAENLTPSTPIDVYEVDDLKSAIRIKGTIKSIGSRATEAVRITTLSGAYVEIAALARVPVYSGSTMPAKNVGSNMVMVMALNGGFRWERVKSVTSISVPLRDVDCGGYIVAGNDPKDGLILVGSIPK